MKRVVITLTVEDDVDKHDLASEISLSDVGFDPTVWEWDDFWKDATDGLVGPEGDKTSVEGS